MDKIVKLIKKETEKIENWDAENFNFDPPVSQFIGIQSILNLDNMLIPPNHLECQTLAKDYSGKSVKLNEEQLLELRNEGTITVPSFIFAGHKHVWMVSPFLQTGKKNIKNLFYNGMASVYEIIFINIPGMIAGNKYFNIWNGLKQITDGIKNILSLMFGVKEMQNKNPDYLITKNLDEFSKNELSQLIGKNKELNLANILTAEKYQQIIKKIANKIDEQKYTIKTNQISRRKELYKKYRALDLTEEKLLKKIANEDAEMEQREILELISQNLDGDEKKQMINLVYSVYLLRNSLATYRKELEEATDIYKQNLKELFVIRSKIPFWVANRVAIFQENWIANHPMDKILYDLVDKLAGNEKIILQTNLNILHSSAYLALKDKLSTEQVPAIECSFPFKVWDYKKGIDGDYNLVVVNSNHFGWRIINCIIRMLKYFYNGSYFLTYNLFYGPFSFRSLYGIDNFGRQTFSKPNKQKTIIEYKTWYGRITMLWNNILTSRRQFEDSGENGIIGKNFTRIFNIFWNYAIKGIVGTFLVGVIHPILVLLNILVHLFGIIILPLWSIIIPFFTYLFNILFYDMETTNDIVWFPLFRVIFEKMAIKGMGQIILSIIFIIFYGLKGSVIFLEKILDCSLRYGYDYFIYHFILKKYAKIPSKDDFLIKRISGPGLGSEYFYLVDHEMSLILLQQYLENLEINVYELQMLSKINTPLNKLLHFYQNFKEAGMIMDYNHERYKTFVATRDLLEEKLRDIKKKYWQNYKIQGINKKNIKMDNDNLTKAIKFGTEICKKFIQEKIFSRMDQEMQKLFWSNKYLMENDWKGLCLYCYCAIFGNSITLSLEDMDKKGFKLIIHNENIKHFIKTIYSGYIIDDTLDAEPFIPYIEIPHTISPDVRIVTLDNLFSTEKYEKMLTISENIGIFNK